MAVFADEEEVGVLVVRLLCVGNGAVGTVEAGSLEELTVYRVTAASENIWLRHAKSDSRYSWRYWGILPFSAEANFLDAEMTASTGVTARFEIYLCLLITVADTCVA